MEIKFGERTYEVDESKLSKEEVYARDLATRLVNILNMKDLRIANISINVGYNEMPTIKFERLLDKDEWEGVLIALEEYELGRKISAKELVYDKPTLSFMPIECVRQ